MLRHESAFCQSNTVVVHGPAGVLLIDPGIYGSEMACLANDLSESGQTVVAAFSTHPQWDHLLWHTKLGAGHGSVGAAGQVRARIDQDRAYVQALRDAGVTGDPRVGPSATFDWVAGVHERQRQHLARRRERDGTPG